MGRNFNCIVNLVGAVSLSSHNPAREVVLFKGPELLGAGLGIIGLLSCWVHEY